MSKIACIILAAGRSTRMGRQNKLLLRIGNKPIVNWVCERALSQRECEVIVVTGYENKQIESSIEDLGLKIVLNEDFDRGMLSSIKKGIQSLSQDSVAFFICLADSPFINPTIMQKMIRRLSEVPAKIIVPTYKNQRGHPVLISSDFIPEILLHEDGDYGCSFLLKKYPQMVSEVSISDPRSFYDIDSISDFEKI